MPPRQCIDPAPLSGASLAKWARALARTLAAARKLARCARKRLNLAPQAARQSIQDLMDLRFPSFSLLFPSFWTATSDQFRQMYPLSRFRSISVLAFGIWKYVIGHCSGKMKRARVM